MGAFTSALKVGLGAATFVTVTKAVDTFGSGEYGKGIALMAAGMAMGGVAYAMAGVSMADDKKKKKENQNESL